MAIINQIDLEEVKRSLGPWLTSRIPDAADVKVVDLTMPSDGMNSETILFTAIWNQHGNDKHKRLVARIQPRSEAVLYTYNLTNEAKAMTALATHVKVPTPAVVGVEEDSSVLGSPFLVMDFVEGRIPPDAPPFAVRGWVLDLTPDERRQLHDNGLATLARIHSADWKALGLGSLARSELGNDPLDQVITYWRRFFEWASAGQSNPVVEAALDWVQANRPTEPEPVVVSWGDSRIGNMIFAADLTVAAVLDFDLTTLASPELDLGWWLFVNRHHSELVGAALPAGIHDRTATIARYEELSGHVVKYDRFYEVLGAVRFAILMVRAGHLMIALGALPEGHPMALNNPATQWLAATLGLPAPPGEATSFMSGEGR